MVSYSDGTTTKVPLESIAPSCHQKTSAASKTLFIWGNSHAQHLYFGLRENLYADWNVLIVASSGCRPMLDGDPASTTDYCKKSNGFALAKILEIKPDAVIVGQAQAHKSAELKALGARLRSAGVERVIFPGPAPRLDVDLYKIILKKLWADTPDRTWYGIDHRVRLVNERLKQEFSAEKDFVYVDLYRVFCNESGCLTQIGSDRQQDIASWDVSHLTPVASDYLAKTIWLTWWSKPGECAHWSRQN